MSNVANKRKSSELTATDTTAGSVTGSGTGSDELSLHLSQRQKLATFKSTSADLKVQRRELVRSIAHTQKRFESEERFIESVVATVFQSFASSGGGGGGGGGRGLWVPKELCSIIAGFAVQTTPVVHTLSNDCCSYVLPRSDHVIFAIYDEQHSGLVFQRVQTPIAQPPGQYSFPRFVPRRG